MKSLKRHLVIGLALPLTLGASVLLAAPAQAATVDVTVSPDPSVYGQAVRATATITPDGCETGATVQFKVDGANQGGPVQVVGGQAVSPPLSDEGGGPLEVGAHSVSAAYVPGAGSCLDDTDGAEFTVAKAATSVGVQVEPTSLVADLVVMVPGGGTPEGQVVFAVKGTVVGSAPLVHGLARLIYTLPPGEAGQVTATYEGNSTYIGSSDATARRDPIVRTDARSLFPATRAGWYRKPVTIEFTCIPGSGDLLTCPATVKLRKSGKSQSVTRTATAQDGGATTVVVGDFDIDRVAPTLQVTDGHCVATDKLSGVAACRLHRNVEGGTVSYRAIAVDRAGNRTVLRGSYPVL